MTGLEPLFAATWRFGRKAVDTAWRHWETSPHRPATSPARLLIDFVEQGIIAVELDPRVHSVGLGGLPNADGIVELDAAWMDGKQLRAGGVAGMRDTLPAISVARLVMEHTPHLLLVGRGAERFARRHGFRRHRLLTEESLRLWREWKRKRPAKQPTSCTAHDTVGVIGWHDGHLVVGCSTSGVPWKLPGRVGDSPIVGAGLYADDRTGAAVATGLGEEILRFSLTGRVVELMRRGASARRACREAIHYIVGRSVETRRQMVAVLAVRKDGTYAAAATKRNFTAYVRSGRGIVRLEG